MAEYHTNHIVYSNYRLYLCNRFGIKVWSKTDNHIAVRSRFVCSVPTLLHPETG